jgi:hypothetical protein
MARLHVLALVASIAVAVYCFAHHNDIAGGLAVLVFLLLGYVATLQADLDIAKELIQSLEKVGVIKKVGIGYTIPEYILRHDEKEQNEHKPTT